MSNTSEIPAVLADTDIDNYAFVPPWVIGDPDLSHIELRVLCVLLTFRGYPEIYPSNSTIAERMGLTSKHARKSVSRSIARLQELGYVTTYERFKDDGSRNSNGFKIHLKLSQHATRLHHVDTPSTKTTPPPLHDVDQTRTRKQEQEEDGSFSFFELIKSTMDACGQSYDDIKIQDVAKQLKDGNYAPDDMKLLAQWIIDSDWANKHPRSFLSADYLDKALAAHEATALKPMRRFY